MCVSKTANVFPVIVEKGSVVMRVIVAPPSPIVKTISAAPPRAGQIMSVNMCRRHLHAAKSTGSEHRRAAARMPAMAGVIACPCKTLAAPIPWIHPVPTAAETISSSHLVIRAAHHSMPASTAPPMPPALRRPAFCRTTTSYSMGNPAPTTINVCPNTVTTKSVVQKVIAVSHLMTAPMSAEHPPVLWTSRVGPQYCVPADQKTRPEMKPAKPIIDAMVRETVSKYAHHANPMSETDPTYVMQGHRSLRTVERAAPIPPTAQTTLPATNTASAPRKTACQTERRVQMIRGAHPDIVKTGSVAKAVIAAPLPMIVVIYAAR